MGCELYPFQVKAICIGGAVFVVFVHLTSAESHKEKDFFSMQTGERGITRANPHGAREVSVCNKNVRR